ncbi:MAG: hypothetical protein RI897_964 [Verrucomicrobiota bacterium]|jgi:hypothetical protein
MKHRARTNIPAKAKKTAGSSGAKPTAKPSKEPVSKPKMVSASGTRKGAQKPAGSAGAKGVGSSSKGKVSAAKQPAKGAVKPAKGKVAAKKAVKGVKARGGGVSKSRGSTKEVLPQALFEAELPVAPAAGGSGRRYALGPQSMVLRPEIPDELGELPEAYGSKRLFLTARDPHWLYAHWDYTTEQLRECNSLSADRHLVLRVYVEDFSGHPCSELRVHPESRNWFIHVGKGGTKYLSELGYYRKSDRVWVSLSRSAATLTPPELMGGGREVHFATIPADVPFEVLIALVRSAAKEHVPLAEAILQLRASGFQGLPEPSEWPKAEWTAQEEKLLDRVVAENVSLDEVRRAWIGSLEITELLRRHVAMQRGSAEFMSSAGLPLGARPSSAGVSSFSSPAGGVSRERSFWFNVNAELIVYGATEPDAQVTLGGRVIRLRPDGTFSFRFALPDGEYELPAVAVSADRVEERRAELAFSRSTSYSGEVGAHPQDSNLKPPRAESVG